MTVSMNDEDLIIRQQIERCRRIASMMTDEELRQSLEQLATEYESRLPKRGQGFMLRHRDDLPRQALRSR